MPEQFLAVTRGAGLPVQKAPPPPVAAAVQQGKAAAAPAPPSAPAAPTPAAKAGLPPEALAKGGPGIPMEEGKRKMIVIWGGVAAVILIGGGLAAFFALRSVKPPAPPTPPAPRNIAPTNVAPANVPPANVPLVNEPPVNVPPVNEPPPPAPDRDTDGDGLTDAEELLIGTDIGLSDSDGDSYSDAQELLNLYNPAGVAPQRLLDSGLVYAYEHPTHGWSIYLPRQWSIAATDQEQKEFKVTTSATGEEVVIRTGLLPECTTREGGPDLGDEFTTKRGAVGFRTTADPSNVSMVCFHLTADRYVGIEHRTSDPPYRFPHLYEVIVQSFSLPSSSAAEQ